MPTGETAINASRTKTTTHRDRLLVGMAAAVDEKGYAESTIADIARHAKVSKRTFYEHFATKQDCLLASYIAASERALARIARSLDSSLDLDAQFAKTAKEFFSPLQESPSEFRTLLVEILAAGSPGLKVRREIHRRYADLLRQLVRSVKTKDERSYELSPLMALAVVSGLYELLLEAVEEDSPETLAQIGHSAVEMLRTASTLIE